VSIRSRLSCFRDGRGVGRGEGILFDMSSIKGDSDVTGDQPVCSITGAEG